MKKNLLFVTALIVCNAFLLNAQTIPNADFESWTSGEPDDWATSNDLVTGYGSSENVVQEVNAQSGSSCIMLETISIFFQPVTGLLTLGEFVVSGSDGEVLGGIPFTDRPTHFNGYYKAEPSGSDAAFLGVLLLKYNSSTGVADTLGEGTLTEPNTVSSWTEFNIPIEYTSQETPDSLNIIFVSSKKGMAVTGSKLWLDNLSLEFASSIDASVDQESVNVYKGSQSRLNVDLIDTEKGSVVINIYDLTGKKIKSETKNSNGKANYSIALDKFQNRILIVEVMINKKRYVKKLLF